MAGPIVVSPKVFVQMTAQCPTCRKDIAVKDVGADRRHTCGGFLPPSWSEDVDTFQRIWGSRPERR